MKAFTIAILMAASTCLTLGAIHLRMWIKERDRWAHLLFGIIALSVVVFSVFEVAMMHSSTPNEYGRLLRWSHVVIWVMVVSSALYLRVYLRADRPWLLWSICILRTISLFLDFIFDPNLNFREITSIQQISVLGESVSLAKGVPNPWMIVAQASLFLLVVYSIDAAVLTWRRGERRRALIVGGSMVLFVVGGTTTAILVLWGLIQWPITVGIFSMGVVAAMGYELSSDVLRARQLGRLLQVRDTELLEKDDHLADVKLALDRSSIVAITDQTGKINYVNDKFCEISGYSEAELIGQDHRMINSGYHSKEFIRDIWTTIAQGNIWHGEIKNRAKDGSYYWVDTTIVPFRNGHGKPYQYVAVRHDITSRILAEEAAHDLGARMIVAQEAERARLARELHDDLSQSLALLSIQLQVLGREKDDPSSVKKRVDELTSQIQRLSSDVHRISRELHPARLEQLGLAAALGGFCREVAAAHNIKVQFNALDIPRFLPNDISLCLYRITQEALQNIQKHSGANMASVTIRVDSDYVRLTVSDNGKGFDPENETGTVSLGLISMRERIRSVHGTFAIESRPGAGTQISVCVPMSIQEID